VKILHTADWHVGKVLKGRSRAAEHAAVLADLVRIAREEDVDLVLVAGDLFDTAAPNPTSQAMVMRTLLRLREDGRQVVALAGNHDSPQLLEAVYRPVLGELGIHLLGQPTTPDNGGLLTLRTRGGEIATVAALPFVSHRTAVRAAEAFLHETSEHTLDYQRRVGAMIDTLTARFGGDSVNLVTTHATLLGGRRGGGEREGQTLLGYELPAGIFPASAHYVALGHLHRQQEIDGPCPIAYSGSPLAVDFGEEANDPVALLVHAAADVRAKAVPVPVRCDRQLRTLRGTLDEVIAEGERAGEAFLRVILAEKARAGLGEQVREVLPNALEVRLDDRFRPQKDRGADRPSRAGRAPEQLFADFLAERGIEDGRVGAMFAELLEEVTSGETAGGEATS
jgi:DNA repair protein SbcD/Mre11